MEYQELIDQLINIQKDPALDLSPEDESVLSETIGLLCDIRDGEYDI